ncbi:hypothetical protein HOD19_04610 [bacterium]|jgi:hypothetical protein|nr:hypothetical protein [bacterium]MBT4649025.1 hypothetical protein [bacterium]
MGFEESQNKKETPEEIAERASKGSDKQELELVEHEGEEMLKVCAWCDQEKNIKRTGNVSHGICEKHLAEQMTEIEKLKK